MAKTIPERSELPAQYCWALEDLYPNDAAWERDLAALSELVETIPAYRGTLGKSARRLLAYLRFQDELSVQCDRLGNYAHRKADEDTRDSARQAMAEKLSTVLTKAAELSDFDAPEILAIPKKTLQSFYEKSAALRQYETYLSRIRRRCDHILSADGEKLLASASELGRVAQTTFARFSNADLTFPDVRDARGRKHPLTQSTYISLLQSGDRTLRENAYRTYYAQYAAFRNTMASTLAGQQKMLWYYTKARNYTSPLERSLYPNEISESVYRELIAAVRQHQPLMARYLKLRKKMLEASELHFYDLYVPLVTPPQKKIGYPEAMKTVKKALAPLGKEYGAILQRGFDERWIDVYENRGKRSGAYSAGARVHPYVLLNYTDDLDGVFTLAHEMGHAMHSYFSNRTQPVIYADYEIFVAEVASTCNEALLMEFLLGRTATRRARIYLLNHYLEQFRATLFRQTMFAEFELKISELEGEGVPLTAQTLQDTYAALLRDYFGDDVVYDDEITMEWARIPHFYYDFYVYQYATGYAAAIALSRRILQEGEPAVRDYLAFLSGGCSKSPIELLRGAGVDMASPKPINDAMALFSRLLDEMEKLTEEAHDEE